MADVKKYHRAFWAKGEKEIAAWPRIMRQMQKALEDRTCVARWMKILDRKVRMYDRPWEALEPVEISAETLFFQVERTAHGTQLRPGSSFFC